MFACTVSEGSCLLGFFFCFLIPGWGNYIVPPLPALIPGGGGFLSHASPAFVLWFAVIGGGEGDKDTVFGSEGF